MNYQRLLQRIRSHPALWGDKGPVKEAQAERIRDKARARLKPLWQARADEQRHQAGERLMRLYE